MTIDSSGAVNVGAVNCGEQERESTCRFIEALVSGALGTSLADLRAASRGRATVAFARQTAMYLAHVHYRLSLTEVGQSFGRDRTTVAHAVARVEDSRDDPKLDRIIECLEVALERWNQSFPAFGAR